MWKEGAPKRNRKELLNKAGRGNRGYVVSRKVVVAFVHAFIVIRVSSRPIYSSDTISVSEESLPDLGDEDLVTFCTFVVVAAGSGSESLSSISRGSRTGPLAV